MISRAATSCPIVAVVAACLLAPACNKSETNPFATASRSIAPPRSAVLVFTSSVHSTAAGAPREIYAMNEDGSGVTRLTFCTTSGRLCDEVEAAPAPDRSRFAVRRTVDSDGNKQLTSADAETLMFEDLGRGIEATFVAGATNVSGIDWSTDGLLLLFSATGPGQDNEDVFNAPPNGQGPSNLTQTERIHERRPRIRPDVGAAVYERRAADGKSVVYLIGAVAFPTQITQGGATGEPLAGTPYVVGSDSDPTFSPDGRSIVFRRLTGLGAGGRGTWDLLVANADGTSSRTIASGSAYRGAPDWGARGICFNEVDTDAGASRLVVIAPDGSNRRVPLTAGTNTSVSNPRWLPEPK